MFSITTTNSAVVALKQPQARCQTSEHSHVLLFSHPVLYRRECTNKALFTWTLHFRYAHIYMKLVFPISFICHEIVFSFFKFNNNIQINIKTILSSQVVWKEAVDYIWLVGYSLWLWTKLRREGSRIRWGGCTGTPELRLFQTWQDSLWDCHREGVEGTGLGVLRSGRTHMYSASWTTASLANSRWEEIDIMSSIISRTSCSENKPWKESRKQPRHGAIGPQLGP